MVITILLYSGLSIRGQEFMRRSMLDPSDTYPDTYLDTYPDAYPHNVPFDRRPRNIPQNIPRNLPPTQTFFFDHDLA